MFPRTLSILATLGVAVSSADAIDVGVVPTKLVVVDKLAAGGTARTVFVARDAAVTKGSGTNVETISVTFTVAYAGGGISGEFVLPAGTANGWLVNKSTTAKFANKSAPAGPSEAKVAVIRPHQFLKVVGKGLGDTPLDILGAGAPSGSVRTAYCVINGSEEFCHCSELSACVWKPVADGTGAKLACKGGTADPGCGALAVSTTTTTTSPTTTTTVACIYAGPFEACNGTDDNCDGQIDEGVVAPPPSVLCGTSPAAFAPECTDQVQVLCSAGSWHCMFPAGVCSPTCDEAVEVEDALDNDCNSLVDEAGDCALVSALTEAKTRFQQHCDIVCIQTVFGTCVLYFVDDPIECGSDVLDLQDLADDLGLSVPGVPAATPSLSTLASWYDSVVATVNEAIDSATMAEICDGCDNDCDGTADDGIASVPCGFPAPTNCQGMLACQAPQSVPVGTCAAGAGWDVCANQPEPEQCDGTDNDCDGVVDDSPLCH